MLKAVRMSAWLLTVAIVILSLVPPELRPRVGGFHVLEHFAIFSATGFAFGLGYRPRYFTAIGLVFFAGAVEVAQLLVPGRHARISDFIVMQWQPASVWRLPTCGAERTNPPPISDRDAAQIQVRLNRRTASVNFKLV